MAVDLQEEMQGRRSAARGAGVSLTLLALLLLFAGRLQAQDVLERLREDVRGPAEHSAGSGSQDQQPPKAKESNGLEDWMPDIEGDGSLMAFVVLPAAGVTSPFWLPHLALGDDLAISRSFAHYPYEYDEGYLVIGQPAPPPLESRGLLDRGLRRVLPSRSVQSWAGRLQVDWGGDCDDLERIDGHLLLSTASRFGLDSQVDYFRETATPHQHDRLWLGDANLVYRFAQSDSIEFRAGVGLNWLANTDASNFGVNFTYGFDFYPRRPWVVSTEIDWGTLGAAELFRFRSTLGVTVHGIEVFTGYEYLDIDRLHQNSLLAGLRFWF